MTQHDDGTRMRHMLDYARKGVKLASGKTRADLDTDELFGMAMTRVVEVIGEAAAGQRGDSRPLSAGSLAHDRGHAQPGDSRL